MAAIANAELDTTGEDQDPLRFSAFDVSMTTGVAGVTEIVIERRLESFTPYGRRTFTSTDHAKDLTMKRVW